MQNIQIGKYLSLDNFCTCTSTYRQYTEQINPYPQNPETIAALQALNQFILEPIIERFGRDKFQLTYGFCSPDLKKYLDKKNPVTGIKNGRIAPTIDQHMGHEIKRGKYYCDRLGAACDFSIANLASNQLVDWILAQRLPFDSLYFYGVERPIHISYGPQHKRDIWTFTEKQQPTKKGIEKWIQLARKI